MIFVALCGIAVTSAAIFLAFPSGQTVYIIALYIGVVALLALYCRWAAGRFTRNFVRTIMEPNGRNPDLVYDELMPFLRRVREQEARLSEQLAEILKERTLLDALSKSMNEGLILVDADGRMQSINQSACTLLGIDASYVGKNILEVIRHIDILDHLTRALTGKSNELIFEISARTYQILFSPVENGALVLLLDITEKSKAEKLRREFSANVSHELKTPLTVVSGYAELIAGGMVKDEDVAQMAAKIQRESARLIMLVEDIIRLSQLDEAVGVGNFSEFDLTEVAREAADSLGKRADDATVTINLPSERMVVTADRAMMFELFYNLIDNGIRYNKPSGKITVDISQKQGKTYIEVSDTGIGIEKKHLSRIFERFYRVDPSRSKKTGGTGLGLSIAKHIVALHNGTITAESKAGVGTAIRIVLSA